MNIIFINNPHVFSGAIITLQAVNIIFLYLVRSKMKCNPVKCLLSRKPQNGVTHEEISAFNASGKRTNQYAKAIEVIHSTDSLSIKAFEIDGGFNCEEEHPD